MGLSTGRHGGSVGTVALAAAILIGATATGGVAEAAVHGPGGGASRASAQHPKAPGHAKPPVPAGKAKPSGKAKPPAHPQMLLDTITPRGGTVGVAQPISIVFSNPVAASARPGVERHLEVTTSHPVVGAWHWFGPTRVDFRPTTFWKPGTKVSVDAALTGVGNGNGRVGVHDYRHTFSVGDDFETSVNVPEHIMRVTENGKVVRTMAIDAGSKDWPTWDGTMAVVNKQKKVRMTSCSVHITCDKKSKDFYDETLPWDVRVTNSGTFIHYSNGDPFPGHGVGSHGCVHLSLADAKWFYSHVKAGDPVTVSGSPRGNAAGDNGYADYNVSWPQWLEGSGLGQLTTHVAS